MANNFNINNPPDNLSDTTRWLVKVVQSLWRRLNGVGSGGSSSGVSSFNTRTGAVTLTGSDVNTALGYTAADAASIDVSVLFDHYDTAGNVAGGLTVLYNDSVTATYLNTAGKKIEASYGGAFVSSGTATRRIFLSFGGTDIFDTGPLTLSLSSQWVLDALIIVKSATTVRYSISLTTEGAALAAYTSVGELGGLTLTGAQTLVVKAQAAGIGAASNDITVLMGTVKAYTNA